MLFVDDESLPSASLPSGLHVKSSYIPRRLVIGNDEYVPYYIYFNIFIDFNQLVGALYFFTHICINDNFQHSQICSNWQRPSACQRPKETNSYIGQ